MELFNEIDNIRDKIASGITNEIEKITYTSLNFHLGSFRQFILLFSTGEDDRFDELMTELEKNTNIKQDDVVRIVDIKSFDRFAENLRKIKKAENIKNNAVGFSRMLSIVEDYLSKP
jgi:hypothetical protein